jgi:hypothetical protein
MSRQEPWGRQAQKDVIRRAVHRDVGKKDAHREAVHPNFYTMNLCRRCQQQAGDCKQQEEFDRGAIN